MKLSRLLRYSSLISCLLFSSSALYAANSNSSTDQENRFNNSKALVISKPGHTFEIKVPANPTTGYLWFLKSYDHTLIEAIKHRYDAPKTNMVGSPGKDVWTFKAKAAFFTVPQITVIEFYSARPFDIRKGRILKLALVSQPPQLKIVKNNKA